MATGDSVPLLAPSSPPPPLQDNSPSALSSPLSEVEDKDTYDDDPDLDMRDMGDDHDTPNHNGVHGDAASDAASESDDDSKLSELDVNDSEAETERLFNTPPKNGATRDIVNAAGEVGQRRFTDRRDRVFERSPSKLHQQLLADIDAEDATSGQNSAFEAEDEDDDNLSLPSSEAGPGAVKGQPLRSSPILTRKNQVVSRNDTAHSDVPRRNSSESRKRKRPSVADVSESDQPLKKRSSSDGAVDRSGNHTAEEDNNEELVATTETKEETVLAAPDLAISSKSKKGRRSPTKNRKTKSPTETSGQDEAPNEPPEDADGQRSEVPTPRAEDDHAEEVDEEAEAAHRNEEELERKKGAWDELVAIEKQFTSFRERCRAQIMSQFYQAVREAREKTLEELGQEWYEVQQERRRAANIIPDYGIRFPATRTQAVRNAVSYNKEVSILSGFAKHIGFPAAPTINGASEDQVEADLEAIHSAREPAPSVPRQVPNHHPPVFRPEYSASLAFNQGLGAAGEQFIEQTRLSNQPGGLFSSSTTTIPNGDSPMQVRKAHLSPGVPEPSIKGRMGAESLRREPAIHAS
ncbi:Transcriptional regulatory protein [Collariella sp. IMI 366227]|nr:Transcriptional regulatory protein [Collariella sp. IMI 366227]